ncbi:nudC domain-containing protein 1-like isoform X1 [Lytechinus variegatus]|uniref:nudC domain-containing protein 1-like isoform X1 n=1 Tax=Lytechinus variegatus TaxID=7654 RepID=UPI001BB22F3C|nr:nudC domain-containing protein 1-like isoform X1 [Lytechinus variegatus]
MATACSEVLRVNRDLLDSQFDGYKLSLDPLPIYSISVKSGVDEVKLRNEEYTLQHMQAFGLTNYLSGDLWNPNCVYFIDTDWRLMQHRIVLESQPSEPVAVFTIPERVTRRAASRHSVSLGFPSSNICVLSDGVGLLYILETGCRDQFEPSQWKVIFKREVCNGAPAILQDTMCRVKESEIQVDCVLLHVEKSAPVQEENGDSHAAKSDYETYLEWITLKKTTLDQSEFEVENSRQLKGKTAPVYCGLEEGAEGLFLASETDFAIISDSLHPVKEEVNDEIEKEQEDTPLPQFTWTQTGEDVILTFIVPETVSKPDIHMVMEADRIDISIKNGKELLSGALYRLIDISCCTWTLDKRKLDVMLSKEDEGFMWTEVVVGDTRGEYVVDPDQARQIHERLAHLTSDAMDPDPSGNIGGKPGISPQDLEECDMNVENEVCIYRIDGKKHTISHKVCISSHQRLFQARLQPNHPPCICLRHDVDGIVWQPRSTTAESPSPWYHEATFNALGYVQASKRNCKFASCAPDMSYCVLCDCSKHAYIYRQPADIPSPLRNRKSGRVVGQIAKQQVVSLDASDDILGLQATNERLFILTSKKLYVIRVRVE